MTASVQKLITLAGGPAAVHRNLSLNFPATAPSLATVSRWNRGMATPSFAFSRALAVMAGVDPRVAVAAIMAEMLDDIIDQEGLEASHAKL